MPQIPSLSAFTDLRQRLGCFVRRFDRCIPTAPSRAHFKTYVSGQLSDLPRKSIEPIALWAGVAPRSLQEFVGQHVWDDAGSRDRVQRIVAEEHAHPEAIALVDETGMPKKGDQTAGVQRQYCGETGKIDHCVVTVHLGYATPSFHTLLDADLYLPQGWHKDRDRCQEAGIPEEVVYRPKWRIALEQVGRALHNGVGLRWLTADEVYGQVPQFRQGVAGHGLVYVVEVPTSTLGWVLSAPPGLPETVEQVFHEAEGLAAYHIKDTGKGPVVWQAGVVPFQTSTGQAPERLILAQEVLTGEVKYYLSNAPEAIPLEQLLHVAFSRARVERLFEDAKGHVGLNQFEVRRYPALMRHLRLTLVSLLFLMKQVERLNGGKKGAGMLVERAPGARGPGGATGPGADPHEPQTGAGAAGLHHRAPPSPRPAQLGLPPSQTTAGVTRHRH